MNRTTSLPYVAAFFAILSPAWAGTITVATNNNNPLNAQGATSPETIAELVNTEVLFKYSNGFTDMATFNTTGQAAGTDGTLSVNGIAANGVASFSLGNNEGGGDSILSITIIGTGPGSTSRTGLIDDPVSSGSGTLDGSALFTSPIGLKGNAPAGNLFADMTLTFSGTGLADASGYNFTMGTEYLTAPITAASGTPEPSSFVLLGGGLVAFGAGIRRRQKNSK